MSRVETRFEKKSVTIILELTSFFLHTFSEVIKKFAFLSFILFESKIFF